ncbi:hypothetical protein SAMN06297358_0890 [Pedobacter xixiisoli]|uniref:Uncharacterized protein n=1 Tax=Pedobacter xixiisoli TaxID=1476464 RepID=A0A285ZTA1_9SPHI|nr:hypothetical protein SAMN06297358_0890 [Pedobacter xixiisoli]
MFYRQKLRLDLLKLNNFLAADAKIKFLDSEICVSVAKILKKITLQEIMNKRYFYIIICRSTYCLV